MAAKDLSALDQRLQALSYSANLQEHEIKQESIDHEPTGSKYICSQCALIFSTVQGLHDHSSKRHVPNPDRPYACRENGCGRHFSTETSLEAHIDRRIHDLHCGHPGCQNTFTDGAHLAQHEELHTHRDNSFHARTCPHPGCGQIFIDQAALFTHYDGLHPLSIFQPGKKNPFKCPFCPKRYTLERYMPSHQRKDHATNQGQLSNDNDDQEALILQSHEFMARKASEASIESNTQPEDTLQEGDENALQGSNAHEVKLEGDTVYMHKADDGLALDHSYEQRHQPRAENVTIGYQLPLQDADQEVTHTAIHSDQDEYPESFALDEYELPRDNRKSSVQRTGDFQRDIHGQCIVHWMLTILQLDRWLGVSEIMDVWDTFLTPDQRTIVLQQLHNIDVGKDDKAIVSALHGSVLCEVIHAWAQFKLLTFQIPLELKQEISSAKGTTLAILRYCQAFETLINEARPMASAVCLSLPDRLRRAPADGSVITPSTPFVELLSALESRVKCRLVHSVWLEFTNEMILKEMARYILDLKAEVKAMYPLSLRTDSWYSNMRVF